MSIWEYVHNCITDKEKVLDIGCGDGDFIRFLVARGMDVTGIDPNINDDEKYHYRTVRGYAENLPFDDEDFDSVVSIRALHHLKADEALSEAYRVLKTGGMMCIVDWKKGAKTSRPERYFTPKEVREALHRAGFRNIGFMPCPDEEMFMVWAHK